MSEPAPSKRYALLRGSLVLLCLGVLGPPVGGLVFTAPVLITSVFSGVASTQEQWQALGTFAALAMLYSYVFGGMQAVIAGIWCGVRVWRTGTVTYSEVFCATLVASAIFIAILQIMQGIGFNWMPIFTAFVAGVTGLVIRWGMGLVRLV